MSQPIPFVTRVRIKNYKSIADCDVSLGPLTVLLGLNASGKSNFVDALSFVADALSSSLQQAAKDRGGTDEIARQVDGPWQTVVIELDLALATATGFPESTPVNYGFELRLDQMTTRQPVTVVREWCHLGDGEASIGYDRHFLAARDLKPGGSDPRKARSGELWLRTAAAESDRFAALHTALLGLSFHAPDPTAMRALELRAAGASLGRRGERLGEVLGFLAQNFPPVKERIDDYLAVIAPGALGLDQRVLDTYSTVQLRMLDESSGTIHRFNPDSMSDGTLRAAGLLAALFQPDSLVGYVTLVCADEPELGLHPTAAGALFDALTEAAEHVQVIVATQSADLLDRKDFDVDWARIVTMEAGLTLISEVDAGTRQVVERRLATLGEELRSNQLTPRPAPAFLQQGDDQP
jgi:predicted ATPase